MNEFYLQRHFKLWEDNNTLLKRVVFLTVVISLSLVIKVLIPFVDFSADKNPLIQVIGSLTREKEVTNKKIEAIEKTVKELEIVYRFISKQPWQVEKEGLKKRYRNMNASPPAGGYSRERYQQEADDTINKIAGLLYENILTPLQSSIDGLGAEKNSLTLLSGELVSLNQFIVDWRKDNTGVDWYLTLDRKDRTMDELTKLLNRRLGEFSRVVKAELDAVKRDRLAVNIELETLNKRIDTTTDKLKVLDDELQKILPEWLRGLVKIEQVIQLLPAALLGSVAFVLFIGMKLTRHYNIYIAGKKFTKDITDDPGMSSTWTLINRGFSGSVQTIVAYTLFIIFTWIVYEESTKLLLEWLSIDPSKAWIGSVGFWQGLLWLSRASFVLLIFFIISRLWRTPRPGY